VKLRRVHGNLATAYPPDGEAKAWKQLKKALSVVPPDMLIKGPSANGRENPGPV
jgi:hypothetical protein